MELLIVIVIIGVLSALIMPAVSQARAKARDARRAQDLRTFQAALELYYENNQHYPIWEAGGGFQDQGGDNPLSQALVVPQYLPAGLPKDPLLNKYVYYYKTDANGSLYKTVTYLETEGAKQEYAAKDGGTASKYYEVFAYKVEEQVQLTDATMDEKMESWAEGGSTIACIYHGSGTAGDPYVLCTIEQVQNMKNCLSCYYELGDDIDASETSSWNGGAGFEPIGTFTGHFDGKNYKITNLYISRGGQDKVGLFSDTSGEIKNLGLENINISGGELNVGALVGYLTGSISNCYSTGSVSGANVCVGGLIGRSNYGSISNCYSTSNVSGWTYTGGLAGCLYTNASISNSYSIGSVSGEPNHAGGLAGDVYEASCNNSFWDTQTSGKSWSACGTGKTTAEMKTKTTFTNASWDFCPEGADDIWAIDDGTSYPCENWQYPTCACH